MASLSLHVDRLHSQPMPLRVLHQYGWRVEAHRLVIQNGACERCQILYLEVGRGIRDKSKTGSMRLGKAVGEDGGSFADRVTWPKPEQQSALLFAQLCCVKRRMLDCVRSAAARYRNHIARGTRETKSAPRLPTSSTTAPNPPFCNVRSVALRA